MNPFFNLARLKNRLGRRTRPGGGKLARRNDLRARRRARPRGDADARATASARRLGEGKSGGGARARNDDDGRERRADAPRRGCDDATRRG